jgi:hypothetical protein
MSALRRASAAWRWVLCIWLGEVAIASIGAYGIRSQVATAMDGLALPDDRLLYAIAEHTHVHPELVVAMVVTLATSALLGFVVWTLLAPLVLLRLAAPTNAPSVASLGGPWLASIAGVAATSAWHLGLRIAMVLGIGGALGSLPPPVAAPIAFVVVLVATCALDFSRVAVVTGGARGGSPRTALDGFTALVRQPRRAGAMAALAAGQWLLVALGLVLLVRTGGDALALMRACAAAATFLGVVRLAVAIEGRAPAPAGGD